MLRPLISLAFSFALACIAIAAPVPKSIRPDPIQLSGPRSLMIRTAIVENGKLKLAHEEHDPVSAPLSDVTATDREGRTIDTKTLTSRLKKPALVIVVPTHDFSEYGSNTPKVDDGDDWRRVLADDVIVIDGKVFKCDWWNGLFGTYDVQLDPVRVDGRRVTTISVGVSIYPGSPTIERSRTLDPDELLEVDPKEWTGWVQWNERRGVEIVFRRGEKTPEEHRKLFREYYFGGEVPHYQTQPAPLVPIRIIREYPVSN